MGACCGKSNKNPTTANKNIQPKEQPTQLNSMPAPKPVKPDTSSQSISIFKPIPNSRKVFFFSVQENKAYILPVSLPFPFPKNSGITQLSPNRFMIAGGTEFNSEDLTSDAMIFEGNALSARRVASLPNPAALQTLIFIEKLGLVYAVGGLQAKSLDESTDENADFTTGDFAVYDLRSNQ